MEKLLGTTKISENSRITLKKNIKQILNVDYMDCIAYYQNDNGDIIIRKC